MLTGSMLGKRFPCCGFLTLAGRARELLCRSASFAAMMNDHSNHPPQSCLHFIQKYSMPNNP